jgi:predicted transcriptional regulator
MAKARVTLDLDGEAETQLNNLAERRGQEKSRVISDALELLESFEADEPDIEEDLRRLRAFEQNAEVVPLDEVKAWVRSWGTDNESPAPTPRKMGGSSLHPKRFRTHSAFANF